MMRLTPLGKQLCQISLFGILLFVASADVTAAISERPAQPDALIIHDIDSYNLNKKNIISRPYPYESELKCPAFSG